MRPGDAELIEGFRLEQLGAAYFEGVAQVASEPEATTARMLALVERKMASDLTPLLESRNCQRADVSTDALEAAVRKGRESGWGGFVSSLPAGVEAAISLYLAMSAKDPKLAPIAQDLIRHERLIEAVAHLPAPAAQQSLNLFLNGESSEPTS